MPKPRLPDKNLTVNARDDDTYLRHQHSKFHEIWALRMGTSLEDRPPLHPLHYLRDLPLPRGPDPEHPRRRLRPLTPVRKRSPQPRPALNELRENWLNRRTM